MHLNITFDKWIEATIIAVTAITVIAIAAKQYRRFSNLSNHRAASQ